MTWPVAALPTTARAILLLPAGMRAFDEDFVLATPPPRTLLANRQSFELLTRHAAGACDAYERVLYVLGGCCEPYGYTALRYAPDEAHDQ